MKKHFLSVQKAGILLLGLAALSLNACKEKGGDDPSDDLTPTITAVSPSTAEVGESITLSGTNFSATAADNTVSIGGTAATVASASTTSLSCTVPDIAVGAADITVTAGGLTSESYSGFTVAETIIPVEVTGFSPDSASYGDVVTITGSGFGTDLSVLSVSINGKEQTLNTATDTALSITLAAKTFSGTVVVNRDELSDSADAEYNYVVTYGTPTTLISDISGWDITTDDAGNIYCAVKGGTNGIQVYDEEGTILDTLNYGTSFYGLYVDESNTLYAGSGAYIMTLDLNNYPQNTSFDTLIDINTELGYVYTNLITEGKNNALYFAGTYEATSERVLMQVTKEGVLTELVREATADIVSGSWYNEIDDRIYYVTRYTFKSMASDGSDVQSEGTAFDYSFIDILETTWGDLLVGAWNSDYLMQADENMNLQNLLDLSGYVNTTAYALTENKDHDLLMIDEGSLGVIKIIVQ